MPVKVWVYMHICWPVLRMCVCMSVCVGGRVFGRLARGLRVGACDRKRAWILCMTVNACVSLGVQVSGCRAGSLPGHVFMMRE